RYGVTGRRKRNMRRVGELRALRDERRNYRAAVGNATMVAGSATPSGALVIDAVGLGKSYGAMPIIRDFSIRVRRGDRIGIVGPNGSGKTTLINVLTGTMAPDHGTARLGSTLEIAALEQHRDSLDPGVTARQALTGGDGRGGDGDTVMVNGKPKHVISYLKDFLFTSEQAQTPLGKLSGGERGRLMLAKVLARPSNLLVLDEPTNDLDMETLDVLEDMLSEYNGTLLLISHDRDFLDRVVSGVIAPEGDGRWLEYAGGYSDMLVQRGADLARRERKPGTRKAPREAPSPIAAPGPVKRRLAFKDKHALETLPETIASLQTEARALQARLEEPGFYARDRNGFEQATAALGELQRKIAAAENRWLELELLREEIAGVGDPA
ncbi:MAG: ATP-binding cassette domain-containing protein, partial [Xanthobacteraceae bacterium]